MKYTISKRFYDCKSYAKKKNLSWDFTKNEYITLITSSSCHYCGDQLNPTGVALDRIDNELGYSPKNTVPCCCGCNRTRNNIYTYEEFLLLAKAIRTLKALRKVS